MSKPSRRDVLRGLAAGAAGVAVVGWNPREGSWATAAGAAGPGVAAFPPLDGTIETAPEALARFAGDFGRIVTGTPTAVLRPGSVRDVAKAVCFAARHGLTLAVNGQSGTGDDRESHSNFGQALAPGGIAVDARGLATIHSVSPTEAYVDAGVTWSDLLDAAHAIGRTPPMLTDFIQLSVGGSLSVGGTGGTMTRFGALVDNVIEVDVVTGTGQQVTCSRVKHPGLFDAVLAGGGQCGVIVRARVKLVAAPTDALVFNLFYDDLDAYLADQLLVLRDGRFSYQEGQIVARPDGTGWRFMLEAASYYTPPAAPDRAALLAGLSDVRADAVVTTPTYLEWAHRVDPAVVALKAGGFWGQPHPWVSTFVPASGAAAFLREVVALLGPADLGAGLATFFPFATARLHRPLMVVPRHEPVAFQLTLLRFPFPGAPEVDRMLAQNRTIHDLAVALGGKRYLIGAIPDLTAADWRRHYGPRWHAFAADKRRYDPHGILTPGQHIFD